MRGLGARWMERHLPKTGEEVEEGFALLPHLGERHAEDNGEADQTQDVGAVRPLTCTSGLKVLSNEKKGGSKMVSIDRSHFKLLTLQISIKNLLRNQPMRYLKISSEACFCYLKTKIVSKHGVKIVGEI
jgi:hypothetical protein